MVPSAPQPALRDSEGAPRPHRWPGRPGSGGPNAGAARGKINNFSGVKSCLARCLQLAVNTDSKRINSISGSGAKEEGGGNKSPRICYSEFS